MYLEEPGSTFTHDKREYDLRAMLRRVGSKPTRNVKVRDLAWIMKYATPFAKRVRAADIAAPIIVTRWKGKLVVLDGLHRLAKARNQGITVLPAKYASRADLAACRYR